MSTARSLPCGSSNDAATLRNYITTYASHPNQLIYNGRVFASTFSGESCQFGQGSVQSGWSTQFLQQLSGQDAVYFLPSFFVATSAFQSYKSVINGMFNVRLAGCRAVCYSKAFFHSSGTLDGLHKSQQVLYQTMKLVRLNRFQPMLELRQPTRSISAL